MLLQSFVRILMAHDLTGSSNKMLSSRHSSILLHFDTSEYKISSVNHFSGAMGLTAKVLVNCSRESCSATDGNSSAAP